ncbi:Metallo-dependent phosphatase-like protein [Mycena metata]|uniref:Metallo-dependent phosphatase-like protein n=1 Tax=Mycena metata TaxID=1033252 RepID=A0AAD7NHF0_9AGAR|nr:Metallo-dependent phosphatase-like protein [Mycena metata]
MAPPVFARLGRWLRNVSVPVSTFISFCSMLLFMFILYQPTPGPGIIQRLGWQSWDTISVHQEDLSTTNTSGGAVVGSPPAEQIPQNVDWWNVTTAQETVDMASLPLDVWSPLLPHDTGRASVITNKDAIRGKWVRVDRNLNFEGSIFSGYLRLRIFSIVRTRRQDVNLITDIKLYPDSEGPPPSEAELWTKVPRSLRTGMKGAPLYLWYKIGKTSNDMTAEERADIITELDLLYGNDIPWYGFEKLEPATMLQDRKRDVESTWLTMRRGVKTPPRAPPLHFSHDGRFKILQIADLHYSVAAGTCRDTPASLSCDTGSDNTTTTSLIATILAIEKPDLVVFTGDQLNGQGTSWDPKSVLAKFSRAVADQGIPWTVVFGNHDEETGYTTKTEQVKLMQALPYSLVEAGPKDVHGVGNYVLKVKSADASKTHLLTLYFLDSGQLFQSFFERRHSHPINPIQRPFVPDTGKDLGHVWDRQSSDQLTPEVSKLAKPNALMFFHMPLPETYSPPDTSSTGRALDIGISGLEEKGNAKGNDGLFEKGILKAMESDHVNSNVREVKVVGHGHCHVTESCRRVKGVWFCFGGGGSYSGYGKLGFDRRFRIYDISDFGETIRTYKRTEHDGFQDSILDDVVLVGKGART